MGLSCHLGTPGAIARYGARDAMPDMERRIRSAGYGAQDTERRIRSAGYGVPDTGSRRGRCSATSRRSTGATDGCWVSFAGKPVRKRIEAHRNPCTDYPVIRKYQPDEYELALSCDTLFEIRTGLESVYGKPQPTIRRISRSGQLSLHPEHE
jgi:hypothetical protein